jgi:hypothetical protein
MGKNWKKHAYLQRKSGTYMKDGQEKTRYTKVGEIWKDENSEQKFYKLYSGLFNDEVILFSQRVEEDNEKTNPTF